VTSGSAHHDIHFGDDTAGSFAAGGGDDVIDAQGGNDSLLGDVVPKDAEITAQVVLERIARTTAQIGGHSCLAMW
jgi:hypothetical protein